MRVLDLCAGELGWSKIFAARGHQCICVDLKEPKEITPGCEFIRCDVLQLKTFGDRIGVPAQLFGALASWEFDFGIASTPCEEFALFGMAHFHPDPPYPELGIRLFNHSRGLFESIGKPYLMENVRAAQQFVGKAVNHCGSFHLWGNAVPPLLPQGVTKGFKHREMFAHDRTNRSKVSATIPPELATCVAAYAESLLEQRAEQRPLHREAAK